jgi:hypothetical protein
MSSGSQDVPCRPNIWMGMKKLIVAFHNFVNAPKNSMYLLNIATKWMLVLRNNVITMTLKSAFVL